MRFMRRSSFFIVRTRAMHFGLWIIAIFDVSDDLDAKNEKMRVHENECILIPETGTNSVI